jgi:hypothetical protein
MKQPISIIIALIAVSSAFPAKPKADPTKVEPFTYANVIHYFKAAHLRATEVQKRCTIFFEGEWKNADIYNYGIIMVENSDEDVQVTFYLTDAHEMNWITEFLDAPFFAPAETQKMFDWINSGRQIRGQRLGRFKVDYHRWQPRHAEIIVFSFTPVRQS